MSMFSFVRSGPSSSLLSRTTDSRRRRRRPSDTASALVRACVEGLETRRLMIATDPDLVSIATDDTIGNGDSPPTTAAEPHFGPKLSSNGRFVAFDSAATNLDPNFTPGGVSNVYLRDNVSGATELVNLSPNGVPLGNARVADMTPDGRYVLFIAGTALYRRDTVTNNTFQVSLGVFNNAPISVGVSIAPNGRPYPALISADGNRVLFATSSPSMINNLIDLNDADDLFIRDINAQRNTLVTPGATNNTTAPATGQFYSISMDSLGVRVVYDTDRTGLGGFGANPPNSTALRRVLLRNTAQNLTVDVSGGVGQNGASGVSTGNNSNPVLTKDGTTVSFIHDGQVRVAKLDATGVVVATALASRTIAGGNTAGTIVGNPRPNNAGGNFTYFWSDGADLVPNTVNGLNLYRYDYLRDRVDLVTLNATGATTPGNPDDPSLEISTSDDGRYVGWSDDSTGLDLSINTYGGAGQVNAYVRDMLSFTIRLLNVSDADPAAAGNGDADNVSVAPDGQSVVFNSNASDLDPLDVNAFWDVFVCDMPDFPLAVVTTLADAPDVFFGGSTVYYFRITYNSQTAVKLSTIGDGDFTVSSASNGYNTPARLLPGSINLGADGTPVSAVYYIIPPGGFWDTADNTPKPLNTPSVPGNLLSTQRYIIHQNGGQVADIQGNPFPDLDVDSFRVEIAIGNNEGAALRETVSEKVGTRTFTFTRTDAFPGPITVNYATVRGTATPGQDYIEIPTTTSGPIAPGGTLQITVTILDDTETEAIAAETFRIVLSNATNGALFDAQQAVISITDDESTAGGGGGGGGGGSGGTVTVPPATNIEPKPGPTVGSSITLNNGIPTVTAPETLGNVIVPLSRESTGTTNFFARLRYEIYALPSDTAVAGQNFVADSGYVEFDAGSNTPSRIISDTFGTFAGDLFVRLLHDHAATGDRTFTVVLSNATTGLLIGGSSIKVVVQDVDAAVQFTTSRIDVVDDAGIIEVPITRTGNLASASTVTLSIAGSSATLGKHFVFEDIANPNNPTRVVTFAPGEATQIVRIRLIGDAEVNGTVRDIVLSIQSAAAATAPYETVVGTPAAQTITIFYVDAVAPQVEAVDFKTGGGLITAITVKFSEKVVGNAARKASNYALFPRSAAGKLGRIIKIASVKYNPNNQTATLIPATPLPAGAFYQLNVNGRGTLVDLAGNRLDGDRDGDVGGSAVTVLGTTTSLNYTDADNDLVSLKLSGPGTLKYVNLNREVTVEVLGPGNNSQLVGDVTKRKGGDGQAELTLLLNGTEFDDGGEFDGVIIANSALRKGARRH